MIRVRLAMRPRSGPPPSCNTTCVKFMASPCPSRASAEPSTGWTCAGSVPGMTWPTVPTPGGKQKGAKTRSFFAAAYRPVDARRNDHHGNATALLLLRAHRPADAHPDWRRPCPAHPSWGVERPQRRGTAAGHEGLDPDRAPAFSQLDPGPLARLEYRAVRGPREPAHLPRQPVDGCGLLHRGTTVPEGHA